VFVYSPVHTGAIDDLFTRLNSAGSPLLVASPAASMNSREQPLSESVGMEPSGEAAIRDQMNGWTR